MGWKHLEDKCVKARKGHHCFMCGEPIGPDEEYVRRTGARDGGIDSFAMHPECEKASKSWDELTWAHFAEGEMDRPMKGGA